MKKRIIRILKFVLCSALMYGFCFNTFASLTASDGSAFVTKTEFDSSLADFNARLLTFEAGINSKIDSQVTSYLDRNGIWSAKEQVLSSFIGPSCTLWLNPIDGLTLLTGQSMQVYVQNTTSNTWSKQTGTVNLLKPNRSNSDDEDFCDSLTKSGLCYIDYTYGATFNMRFPTTSYRANNTTEKIATFLSPISSNYALRRFVSAYASASADAKKSIKLIDYTTTDQNPSYDGMGIYSQGTSDSQSFTMTTFLQVLETYKNSTNKILKTSTLAYTCTTGMKEAPLSSSLHSSEPYYYNVYNFGGTLEPVNTNTTFFVSKGSKLTFRVNSICSDGGWNNFGIAATSTTSNKPAWCWAIQINNFYVY